jgi:hypothetical protein
MDTIIQKTGQIFYILNLKIRKYFYTKILRNHTSVVLFILIFCLIAVLIGFFGLGYSIHCTIVYSLVFTFLLFLVLLFIGSYAEAKRLQMNELNSWFLFCHSNLNGISINDLGFSESDRENFNLILNNLQPNNKIDFHLVSDNRAAADYKKLFRILHLLIIGGIKDFKKEHKEKLFKFIESTFTLNGSEVNRASLNSRFSEWVNESETEFTENLKPFQKILNL